MSSFYKLHIKEVKKETSNAISVVFSVPDELKTAYQFVAGQYVNLKLTLDGKEIRRAYSICSSPNSGELRIAIKSVKNGHFSTFANENLKVGDFSSVKQTGKYQGRKVDFNRYEAINRLLASGSSWSIVQKTVGCSRSTISRAVKLKKSLVSSR